MNIYCIIPTWKEYPTEAVESIKIQKQQPACTVIGLDNETKDDIKQEYLSMLELAAELPHRITQTYEKRAYAALNIFSCINSINGELKDDSIIVLIDGDDRLFDEWALLEVFKAHSIGAWVTYGSYYKKSALDGDDGNPKNCKLYRNGYRGHENYRELPWRASHLKTFRYGLYRRLKPDWYKGPNGEPLRVCSDLALMFPMLEMAGKEHVRFINKPLYIYNDTSEFNDHKVRGQEQKEVEAWIRMQEPYKKVHSLSGAGAAVMR